ncbi:MAG: hypothetical protein SGPRY_003442 [Prymnesium sp.]
MSSADEYHLGAITSNKLHAERARVRKEADDEKKKRANERAQRQQHHLTRPLSRQELLSVLHCVDIARKKEHTKLRNKAEMMDYMVKLFPDLPADGPVVPRAVGRVTKGERARKRRTEVASESEKLESDESNHSEEYEDTEFTMVMFMDACR